jgi:hypothetical protein
VVFVACELEEKRESECESVRKREREGAREDRREGEELKWPWGRKLSLFIEKCFSNFIISRQLERTVFRRYFTTNRQENRGSP